MQSDQRRTQRITSLLAELNRGGIRRRNVLMAIASVPRERFVSEAYRESAWENRALPIGEHQTISQPQIVGLMTQALNLSGDEDILEIGTGSGYQAAILARLCHHVTSIERFPSLAESARERLREMGVDNVTIHVGDGTQGWPDESPWDGIIVTAAAPHLPPALREQLSMKDGARIVIPIGDATEQDLFVFERFNGDLRRIDLGPVRFVPLVGQEGWAESNGEEK